MATNPAFSLIPQPSDACTASGSLRLCFYLNALRGQRQASVQRKVELPGSRGWGTDKRIELLDSDCAISML
jgi:hypothetical protein